MSRLEPNSRAIRIAQYLIESKDTVRGAAKIFNISKSTVHLDITKRLPQFDPALAEKAQAVINYNKSVRHIRGGTATRLRFKRK